MAEPARPWRCYVCEAIGTFALVFAGTGAIVADAASGAVVGQVGVALTFGLVVMAMIYSVGDVSGAHINPAVTLGFYVSGRLAGARVPGYVLSQCGGAVLASVLVGLIFGRQATLGATLPVGSWHQSFVLELVLSGMLMFVILCVAAGAREKGLMAGIAVGGWVGLAAMFGGPVSGASMNPARSLGPALVSGELGSLWIYMMAPALGACLAVVLWRLAVDSPAGREPEPDPSSGRSDGQGDPAARQAEPREPSNPEL